MQKQTLQFLFLMSFVIITFQSSFQASHKLGCHKISKRACSVLWNIFVASPSDPPSMSWTSTVRQDYELTVHHLNREVAMESSPVLLYHAVTAVFVAVEVAVREKELFCDKFSEEGPILESKYFSYFFCFKRNLLFCKDGWMNFVDFFLNHSIFDVFFSLNLPFMSFLVIFVICAFQKLGF